MGFFLLSVGSSARKGHGFPSIKHRGHGERSAVRIIFRRVLRLGGSYSLEAGERVAEPLGKDPIRESRYLSVSKRYNTSAEKSSHLVQNPQFP